MPYNPYVAEPRLVLLTAPMPGRGSHGAGVRSQRPSFLGGPSRGQRELNFSPTWPFFRKPLQYSIALSIFKLEKKKKDVFISSSVATGK